MRRDRETKRIGRFGLAAAALLSAVIAVGLTACTQVAGTSSPGLVRVIDASYIAPPLNVTVAGTVVASDVGKGTITQYSTVSPSNNAAVTVADASGGGTLDQAQATLLGGSQASVFIADYGAAHTEYNVTVLEDANTPAPSGQSSFRFLNQASKTGAVDIYLVPSGTKLANAKPLVAGVGVGDATGYISFTSQTVVMAITAAGSTKAAYSSQPIALAGGEVRTVLVLDSALTANPAVEAFVGNDVN